MNAVRRRKAEAVERERDRIDLTEENRRLKQENEHLVELLAHLNEEMHNAAEFWRLAYLSLARTWGLNKDRMGETIGSRHQSPLTHKEFQRHQCDGLGG